MGIEQSHAIDAFRSWLIDRSLRDIPAALVPAWLLATASEWLCKRLVGRWQRWLHRQAARVEREPEAGGRDA